MKNNNHNNLSNEFSNITVGNDFNNKNSQVKSGNQIDKSKNNTKEVTINNKIYKIPKRISNEELEKIIKLKVRPNLQDKLGQYIECFGYVVGQYKDVDGRYTVINVIDVDKNIYTSDHIQLDFKENLYDYSNDIGHFIRFEGIVIKYPKGNSFGYTINITSKVKIMMSAYINLDGSIDYSNEEIDFNKIKNYLYCKNITKIYDLIDKIRFEINKKLEGVCSEDFIYYYIINQLYLNQATYYIYDGRFENQGFSGDSVINTLIILSNVLYELTTNYEMPLTRILNLVAQSCNVIQGVENYNNIDSNPKLIEFIKTYIGKNTGKKKLKSIWNFIQHRKENFNELNPNVNHWKEKDLVIRAYTILNEYIYM